MSIDLRNVRTTIAGAVGALEIAIDCPAAPRACALICHPHPQGGGSMDNKVVTTLAKTFTELGFAVARFNYRGVGKSEGVWDEGCGELEDARAALAALQSTCGANLPLFIAGFSFGGFIAAQLSAQVNPAKLVLIAPAVFRFQVPMVSASTIVVHGENDELVPLADVLNWARPQALPVLVFPGCGHFFHGQLLPLREKVKALCQF